MTKYLGILILFALFSCKDQNMTFNIGSQYVTLNTNLHEIDSSTIRSYTVRLDSMHTSGLTSGSIVAGKYHDPEIGDVRAVSYFKISFPGVVYLPQGAVFDSIRLMMLYNKYSIGDTLQPCTLHVHRILVNLKANTDNYMYNTSRFSYDSSDLGAVTFTPRPNTYDSLNITLDPAFGQNLFDLIKTKDDKVATQDNFFTFFKGLVVSYDNADDVILGYKSTGSTPVMRLYYHYFNFTTRYQHVDYPIYDYNSLQFNNFSIVNPVVPLPTKQTDKLPSQNTDNSTLVQGGTGIVTRLEFPYLRNILLSYENVQVLRAELVIEPLRNTYNTFQLPKYVSLFESDRLNRFISPIYNGTSSSILVGTLNIDAVYQEETKYTFDVTDFVNSSLTAATDDIPALLVILTPEYLYNSLDRLVLASRRPTDTRMKLKIYYMTY